MDWTGGHGHSSEHLVMIGGNEQDSAAMLPLSQQIPIVKKESIGSPYPPSSPMAHEQHKSNQHIGLSALISATSIHPDVMYSNGHGGVGSSGIGGQPDMGNGCYGGGTAAATSKSELLSRYASSNLMSTEPPPGCHPNEYHPNLARRISGYESCSSPDSPDRHFCSSTTQSNGEPNNSIPEENSKEVSDSPKRVCLVCGDTASGFHYGVASCEACKAFFKRTIQGNIEYTCPASNDCEINKRRRKACQACRFQKCLRMGMLKEGVRLDRVRGGRQKYRRNSDIPYATVHHAIPPKKPTLEENKILHVLMGHEPDILGGITSESHLIHSDIRMISILSDLYDKEIISTISWAKQVPGFTELNLNDQMRLLQSTWTEVLTLSLVYRSMSTPGRLIFASDFSLDEKQSRDSGVYELYQPCFQVLERFERVGILKEEYCLLKALILVNADTRIDDYGSLKKLRENVLSALFDCATALRSGNAVSHVNSLLLCLPMLRQADLAIKKFWLAVRREGKIVMNKLFVEMLEAYFR